MNLRAGGLFDGDRDDLVFLLRTGTAHLDGAGGSGLHRIDVVLHRLVRLVGVHPEHEFVERQHGDRREILPVERNSGCERGGEEVGECDDDLVRISWRSLDVEEAFAAGAARLVDDDHRLLHQIVLGDDALDGARHLIGAAAGAGGNDELDWSHRLPCGSRRGRDSARADRGNRPERKICRTLHLVHSRRTMVTPVFAGLSSFPIKRFGSSCTHDHYAAMVASSRPLQFGIVGGTQRRGIRSFRPIVDLRSATKRGGMHMYCPSSATSRSLSQWTARAIPLMRSCFLVRAFDLFLYMICHDANGFCCQAADMANLSQVPAKGNRVAQRKWPRKIGAISRGPGAVG